MHLNIPSAELKNIRAVPDFYGAERLLLTACVCLMTLAVFLRNFDDPLLRAIYRFTHAENAAVWRAVSTLGSGLTLTPVVASVTLAFVWRGRNLSALALALGWAATSLTVEYMGWLLDRSRPPLTPWVFAAGNSFPSAHAAQAAFVYLSLAFGLPGPVTPAGKVGGYLWKSRWIVLVGLAGAIGCSRLALGVHWPSDVAAGWGVGLFFCAVTLVLRSPSSPPAQEGVELAGDETPEGS